MSRILSTGDQQPEDLQDRMDLIRHKLKFIDRKPRVACIEGLSPLKIAGGDISGLVEIAGGIPVGEGKLSSAAGFGALQTPDPDIVIVIPRGFTIARTLQDMHLLFDQSGWKELKAVQNDLVYIADGSEYFYREAQRLVDSLEILAEIINPKQFVFGYEGTGWIKFSTK